jgi:hypothetical protein
METLTNTLNKPGRPPGSLNRISATVKSLLADWAEHELKNISDLYAKLSPKEKAKFITNILPYIVPRMRDIELNIERLPQDQIEEMIKMLIEE